MSYISVPILRIAEPGIHFRGVFCSRELELHHLGEMNNILFLLLMYSDSLYLRDSVWQVEF